MLQATATPLEGNRVRLTVEVGEDEFSAAIDSALREVASSVRLPGFRPGKAPKRVVEARVGRDVVRQEALRDSLPGFLRRAAAETGTDAIGQPEVEVTSDASDPVLRFDAVVETRPKPAIPGYEGLRVTVPSPMATDGEIDHQIDRMRDQFGSLEVVGRPARTGDHVTIDIKGYRHSESIEQLTVDDLVYEIGSGALVEGLDEQLVDAKSGDIFKFNAPWPQGAPSGSAEAGPDIGVQVLVKEVKEKKLPAADDQWASDASEFSTIAELRADIAARIAEAKRTQARIVLRSGTARELANLVTDDPPEVLVDEEIRSRLDDLQRRLDAQRVSVAQYLAVLGQEPQAFMESIRSAAIDTVRLDLALRSLASAEDIQASEDEIEERLQSLATRADTDTSTLRDRLAEVDGLDAIVWDIRKSKALDWLVDHVGVFDEEGREVDRAELEAPEEPSEPTSDRVSSAVAAAGEGAGEGAAGGAGGEVGEKTPGAGGEAPGPGDASSAGSLDS